MFCTSTFCCSGADADGAADRPRLPYTPSAPMTSEKRQEPAEELQEPWVPKSVQAPVAPEVPPPQTSVSTFKVTVDNKDQINIGLACDRVKCGHLFIDDVSDLIKDFNRTAAIQNVVKKGDFLVFVNGIRENSLEMAEELDRTPEKLELELRRSFEFSVVITDTKKKLGVELSYSKASMSLFIREVAEEGMAAEHNKKNPESAIREGDRVIAVNGITGTASQLLEAYRGENSAVLTICRPIE